jgi:hypothetical protein
VRPFVCEDLPAHFPNSVPLSDICRPLSPTALRLLPSPKPNQPFPVPEEGSEESEGLVLFEAQVQRSASSTYLAIQIADGSGNGWVVGGFHPGPEETVKAPISMVSLLMSATRLSVWSAPTAPSRTLISLPNLVASSLVVYTATPRLAATSACSGEPLKKLLCAGVQLTCVKTPF